MASALGSCASGQYRILEIKLRFSDLKIKNKHALIYMKLWLHQQTKLRTSVVKIKAESKFEWEEKFVFSISENFLRGANTSIFFEIYEARKLLRDSVIGTAHCDLNSLFNNKTEKNGAYDTEQSVKEEEDPRYDNIYKTKEEDERWPELRASAIVEVTKSGSFRGHVGLDGIVWNGAIASVGASRWHNLAMTHQDFMFLQGHERKRSWLCFVPYTDKD